MAARTSPSAPETDSRFSGDSRVGPRPQGEEAGDMGLKRAWTTRTPHSHEADGVLPELPSGQIKYRWKTKEEGWAERGRERMDVGKRQDSHLIWIGEMGKLH